MPGGSGGGMPGSEGWADLDFAFFSGRGLAIQTCTLSHTLDACQSRRLGCGAWTPTSVSRAAGIALPG